MSCAHAYVIATLKGPYHIIPDYILIMHKLHFHFLSLVACRLHDGPVSCLQLRYESESAARAILEC